MNDKWYETHCCQGRGDYDPGCPMLYIHRGEDGEREPRTRRPLQKFGVYCGLYGKLLKIGELAAWTGLSPAYCPIRKEREGKTL